VELKKKGEMHQEDHISDSSSTIHEGRSCQSFDLVFNLNQIQEMLALLHKIQTSG